MVQFSHPYMTTGKTRALTIWTFLGKIISLPFNMLSRFVIAFLTRSKCLLLPLAPQFQKTMEKIGDSWWFVFILLSLK